MYIDKTDNNRQCFQGKYYQQSLLVTSRVTMFLKVFYQVIVQKDTQSSGVIRRRLELRELLPRNDARTTSFPEYSLAECTGGYRGTGSGQMWLKPVIRKI